MSIQEQIQAVAQLRRTHASFLADVRAKKDAWEHDNADLIAASVRCGADLEAAEEELRGMAVVLFLETGNKNPAPGVGIRVNSVLEYDVKVAFAWATEHKLALALDKRVFERIAKSGNLDFVVKTEVPMGTIATDLDQVLEEKNPAVGVKVK